MFARLGRDKGETVMPGIPTALPETPTRDTIAKTEHKHRLAPPGVSPSDAASAAEAHEAYVARQINELMDLAMTEDTNSLHVILSELNNRDPRIREAAVTASVQFKSPDAIPALRDAYPGTDDLEEKVRIARAIDFLSLVRESQLAGQTN